ncbi:pLS20_p028 family conjugation system transmembrane protein (plasmid) [Clostridium perfringens]
MTLIELTEMGILSITGLISHAFRWLGWQIIWLLASLVDGVEGAVNKIYTLNSFFSSSEVNNFIDRYKPIIWSILAISLAVLGYKIIMNRKMDKQSIPTNLIFSLIVVIALPMLMVKMGDLTNLVVKDVKAGYTSSAKQIVKDNLYDLYALDQNDFNFKEKNNIPIDNIFDIHIDEAFKVDGETKHKNIFENKLNTLSNGKIKETKLEKNWIMMDEDYYRYNIDFVSVIIGLATTGITLLCVGFKIARLIFELAFNKLFAMLFAFADIEDNKKIKAILKNIFSTFAVIMATAVLLKLYIIFVAWLNFTASSVDTGIGFTVTSLAKLILQIGASFAVIDGPNIIERILGIDAGLKSGLNTMLGTYGAMKALSSGTKSMISGTKGFAKATGGAVDSAIKGGAVGAGAMNGLFKNKTSSSGTNDNETENKSSSLQNEMKNANANSNANIDKNINSSDKNTNKQDLQSEMNNDKKSNEKDFNNSNIENSAKLHDDMKNLGVETTETLQDEMNGLNNKNNDNLKLNEEMNKETSKSNSPNLQEEMKGADNIKNDNSSLQDEIKNGSFNDDLRRVNNSPNENLQSEMSGKEELSSGGKLNDEMNRKTNENSDFRSANPNINPVNESMKNRESSNVNNDGNNGASQRSFRQVDTKENFATRKSREIKQAYKLGQSATERFNIPKNYKNLKDKKNNRMKGDN